MCVYVPLCILFEAFFEDEQVLERVAVRGRMERPAPADLHRSRAQRSESSVASAALLVRLALV